MNAPAKTEAAAKTAKPAQPLGSGFGSRLVAVIVGIVLVCGLALLLLWQTIFVRILPGHVGVLYSLLFGGTVTGSLYPEGLAVKLPWNRMYIFETRLQALPFRVQALSAEGMPITVEATTLFRVQRQEAANLLIEIGSDYTDRVVAPMSIFALRQTLARYNSHELYTVDADKLQDLMLKYLKQTPQARYIDYQEVAIREVRLAPELISAIHQKLTEEQNAAAYEFRLAGQRLEAERLRIEAIGLRNFYSIVQSALTDKLLTWRGIEATVQIAKSPNTKIVIVGGNKDQLPLILGSDITRQPAAAEPPVTPVPGDASPLPDLRNMPSLFPNPLGAIQPGSPTAPAGAVGPTKSEAPPSRSSPPASNPRPRPDVVEDKRPEPKSEPFR